MNKPQKVIIGVSAALIIAAVLFPPYWDYKMDHQGHMTVAITRWEFNREFRMMIEDVLSGQGMLSTAEFPVRRGLLNLETLGIFVLAVAAFLIARKKQTHRKSGGPDSGP